jgi:hypothetical protein
MVAVGASRRSGRDLRRPDRHTAYIRVDATSVRTLEQAREALGSTPPEPDFPVSRMGGLGPLVTRPLRARLGSTALVSNLGRLSGDPRLREATFWPVAAGPCGVALGLVTVGSTTTLSLRVRRADFDRAAAQRLLDLVAARLTADGEDGAVGARARAQ